MYENGGWKGVDVVRVKKERGCVVEEWRVGCWVLFVRA